MGCIESCLVQLEKEGNVVISSKLCGLTVNVGQVWSERHGKEQVMRATSRTRNMRQAQPSDTNSVVTFSARFMHSGTIKVRDGGLPVEVKNGYNGHFHTGVNMQ